MHFKVGSLYRLGDKYVTDPDYPNNYLVITDITNGYIEYYHLEDPDTIHMVTEEWARSFWRTA